MIISLANAVDVNASVIIPFDQWTQQDRAHVVADDPTTTAYVFHRKMEKMFQHLVGMAPETRIKGERPAISDRRSGIYGKVTGYYGVYECQGRVWSYFINLRGLCIYITSFGRAYHQEFLKRLH
jgi:hypothetical protein